MAPPEPTVPPVTAPPVSGCEPPEPLTPPLARPVPPFPELHAAIASERNAEATMVRQRSALGMDSSWQHEGFLLVECEGTAIQGLGLGQAVRGLLPIF